MSRSIRVEFVDGPLANKATSLPARSVINPCPARWNNHPGGTYEMTFHTPHMTRVVYTWKPATQRIESPGVVSKESAWRKAWRNVIDQGAAEGLFEPETVQRMGEELAQDESRGPGMVVAKLVRIPITHGVQHTESHKEQTRILDAYCKADTHSVIVDRNELYTALEEAMVSIMRHQREQRDHDAYLRLQQLMRKHYGDDQRRN